MYSELVNGGRGHWDSRVYEKIRQIDPISTMSVSRVFASMEAISHVAKQDIRGDIVECGVFKGGNIALFACEAWERSLDRKIWAYDTFSGVPYNELEDIDTELHTDRPSGASVADRYLDKRWCSCDIDQVMANVAEALVGLCGSESDAADAKELVRYVQGSVMDTIPLHMPDSIGFVRLDMDIAQPTRHALDHMWPRLSVGGVIHVDDYNSFGGVHEVIDRFFSDKSVYVHEIDHTAISIVRLP